MTTPSQALILGTGAIGRAMSSLLAAHGFAIWGYDPAPGASEGFQGNALDLDSGPREWSLIVICVPTPTVAGQMSVDALVDALRHAARSLTSSGPFATIAIRSTLVPGTMETVVRPLLADLVATGRAGVCYWPSFARERSAVEDEGNPKAIVFGTDGSDAVRSAMSGCVAQLGCEPAFVNFAEAELIKHGANAFNALKISYFNAVGDWSLERGVNGQTVATLISTVAEGCWNPDYGSVVGPPFGGACLPKDLDALIGRLDADDSQHRGLLRAVKEINEPRPNAPPAE